ncbi:hypothetical protein Pyn_30201 [Prunus yedoensis var. nudiflora]|uniref:Uncharacterized protein n=1 Tax=Prunus yedoensis var. nudiflora TaxID=2094558 RepID=A0A314YQX2_PRUYE|nr:hypothetical protein Pyn_30201 [Prunus yedoensis var. nudiflora]
MWMMLAGLKRPPFIAAGSWPFPRNPNGFYPILTKLFPSFLLLSYSGKIFSAQSHKIRDFWELIALPAAATMEDFLFPAISISSFLLSSVTKSDGGKEWVCMLVQRVILLIAACVPTSPGPLDVFA